MVLYNQRILEVVDSTPVEIVGPETEIVPDNEYELKFAFELKPWPLISNLTAVLIQWLNRGEEALRTHLISHSLLPEVRERDTWWEWAIPNISVKKVWFKYRFIARSRITGIQALPIIGIVPLAKFIIAAILVLAGVLIGLLLIKIFVFLSSVTPVLSWVVVSFLFIAGILIIREVFGAIGGE
jgi:hypothetical protein